jgi:hypothetical protein
VQRSWPDEPDARGDLLVFRFRFPLSISCSLRTALWSTPSAPRSLLFAFPAYPLPLSAYRVKFPGFFFLAYSFELSAFSFMLPTHASAPFIYSIQIPKNFYFIMHGLHEAFDLLCLFFVCFIFFLQESRYSNNNKKYLAASKLIKEDLSFLERNRIINVMYIIAFNKKTLYTIINMVRSNIIYKAIAFLY